MVKQLQSLDILDAIQNEQFATAQKWWWWSKILQFVGLLLSLLVVIGVSSWISWVVVVLAIASVLVEWRFDYLWEISQALHRKHEFWDSLGWQVSGHELSNLQANMPKKLRSQLEALGYESTAYFASGKSPSPRRLTENLMESSWWTWHLANRHWKVVIIVSIGVLVLAIIILLLALEIGVDPDFGQTISRIIVAIFAFMLTAGYFRLAIDYYRLYQDAKFIEQKAEVLLLQEDIDSHEAIALYTDYQFSRVGSPPVLTVVWQWMKDDLNQSWNQHRQQK